MSRIGAMVLAAGKSTRLHPLTLLTPKVLLPVGGRPMIDWTLAWLNSWGINRVAMNLHHLGDVIEDYVGDGSKFGVNISYSREEELLGTALGAKRMSAWLGEIQVVVYGDVLTDFNLPAMVKFHIQRGAVATLALFLKGDRADVGAVRLRPDDRIINFVERPQDKDLSCRYANGGVYVVNRSVFQHVPDSGFSDFGQDLLPKLVNMGLPVFGYRLSILDYLLDMGTIDRYARVDADARNGKVKIKIGAGQCRGVSAQDAVRAAK